LVDEGENPQHVILTADAAPVAATVGNTIMDEVGL